MRTKTVNIYKFDELSEKAKQKAKDKYAELFGYAWAEESIDSMKALAKHFDGMVKNYSISFFNSSYSNISFDMPELEPFELEERIGKLGSYNPKTLRGNGDCVLTGFCHDEDAIDGLRKAWINGEKDIDKLMQAAFDSWLKACQADCEDQYTDERFSEHSDANNYEYNEDGSIA